MSNDEVTQNLDDDVFRGKRILLVDDDERNVFALKSVLHKKRFEIIVAKTGQEAIDCLCQKEKDYFDLVLMDIMMPEMDGYEAMRHIREHKTLANIPVIALTAKAMTGDREKCLDAGATNYVSKPIDVEHLLSIMHTLLV